MGIWRQRKAIIRTWLPPVTGLLAIVLTSTSVYADPCGMVPPIDVPQKNAIERKGPQKTYVFFDKGVETFVIRPGFSGEVDNFGMLIPFPSPPAIRKVPDQTFDHIAKAIDPPEVVVDLRPPPPEAFSEDMVMESAGAEPESEGLRVGRVQVLSQEAIGMYEIAVLQAGSNKALSRWMDDHHYAYPAGMDAVVADYVKAGWPFVAVKTRVGVKRDVDPRPGMKNARTKMAKGEVFDGFVQAMGFRFKVKAPVVPMRLSTFNPGEMRNIVYFLGEQPVKIVGLDTRLVRRQLRGDALRGNVVGLLPVRILGGNWEDIPKSRRESLQRNRNPAPFNQVARELFASDLLAVSSGKLAHAYEEREKALLNISERLLLRGPAVDQLHQGNLAKERKKTLKGALAGVDALTLTVFDGEFPRSYLADNNITFEAYEMNETDNLYKKYDATLLGPRGEQEGVRVNRDGSVDGKAETKNWWKRLWN